MSFELRGQLLRIQSAQLYESSAWDATPIGEEISDEVLVAHGVVLVARTRSSRVQEPYIYVDEKHDSARGFWLKESEYSIEADLAE